MITFFAAPKPFRGHIGTIQRNAIQSWKRIHPSAEIILFGDEEGIAEAARDLAVGHVPEVRRNEHGTPFLSSIFDHAKDLAQHTCLCYVNSDIILLSDFRAATERVIALGGRFLMAGQRWDTDITEPVDFSAKDWETKVRREALKANRQQPPKWIDFFVFSSALYYQKIPEFVIGRTSWDNWLVWYARDSGALVVDASAVVCAVHQNHDYSHHPDGATGVWQGVEAQRNSALLRGGRCFATMENATHRLTTRGLRPNYYHWIAVAKLKAMAARNAFWFGVLDASRPVRRWLGLRQRHSANP